MSLVSDPRQKLASFTDHLEEELAWRFDVNDFYDRIRMQKYVKLAEAFGFEHSYEYGIYIHGPYSPSLAKDYYSDVFERWRESTSQPPRGFDTRGFTELVGEKDHAWLEVAATIRFLDDRSETSGRSATDSVLDRVTELKDVSYPEARAIHRTLEEGDALAGRE